MNKGYDYIIIGSGFGGSVAALRLAEKEVARGRRRDKRSRLNTKIADGSWDNTRSLRKKFTPSAPCLRNLAGDLRPASERAKVMAEYLRREQFGLPPHFKNFRFQSGY